MVGGLLEGDLASTGKTEVISTGKVIGNIRTKSLIVDENAVFQGQCVMNTEAISTLPEPSAHKSGTEKTEEQEQDSQKDTNNNKWNKR